MNKQKIDIALIQPPGWASQNPPLGLALLKSYLAGQNLQAKIFDANIMLYNLRHGYYYNGWEISNGYFLWERESYARNTFSYYSGELLNFIYSVLSLNPDVIGFSTHCSSLISARLLARKFKQFAPETRIVFGGPQVAQYTSHWVRLLDAKEVDAVVFGEGEGSLTEYLNKALSLDQPIKGVAYLGSQGQVINGGSRDLIPHLDTLPFADFSDFDVKLYAGFNVLPTYFSRGCINRCIYCTENKFFPKFRSRSGQRVFDEVVHQLSLYPQTDYFRLHDSISNGNVREMEKFCDLLIANNVNIRFDLENAVVRKEMNAELYSKLKRAGCTLIGYGLETPSKRLLKSIGKLACQNADFDKVITEGVKAKIEIGINMMFGLPGETEEDFQQQMGFIKRHKKHRKHILINPALNYCYFPEGCAVYDDPEKYGVDLSVSELFWSSKDGKNNFVERMRRFEEFCTLAAKLGYKNLFNVLQSVNKYESLGYYYLSLGDYDLALSNLKKSFNQETRTLELVETIIDIYDSQTLEKDETFAAALQFKKQRKGVDLTWSEGPQTFEELEQYIISFSITNAIGRLNSIVESLYEPSAKMSYSVFGIKKYIKYLISKFVRRSDKKYFVLIQLIQNLENKLNAIAAIKCK